MMVRRLARILAEAADEQWSKGTFWYASAHSFACQLADEHDVTVECAAGVIAALSPRLPWDQNVAAARQLFATGDAPVLGSSKAKALRIRAGESPVDVLGGDKVIAFYRCVLFPANDTYVCVDRHAVDAALGAKGTDASRKRILERKGGYEIVADAYRRAAERFGVAPAQAQAIVWVCWREQHAGKRAA